MYKSLPRVSGGVNVVAGLGVVTPYSRAIVARAPRSMAAAKALRTRTLVKGGFDKLKRKKKLPGRAEFSMGNQGILFPSESNGRTSIPGKGVGDGNSVGVGSGVNVAGTGVGVEAGAHPIIKTARIASVRKTPPLDFFMTILHFPIAQDNAYPSSLRGRVAPCRPRSGFHLRAIRPPIWSKVHGQQTEAKWIPLIARITPGLGRRIGCVLPDSADPAYLQG